MNTDILLYITAGCVVLLIGWLVFTELRLRKFFRGKSGEDLESVIRSLTGDIKNLQSDRDKIENYLENAEERLKKSLKKIGIVRYNPYSDAGSNQSFSIALLDERGDGAVISTLYTRDNIKTYAKAVKNYKSEYTLTPEEEESIRKTQHET